VDAALRGYATDADPGDPAAAPASGAPAAEPAVSVGKNRNPAADIDNDLDDPEPDEYQGEIQLVVDPNDPDRMVAAANTWDDAGGTCGDFGMQAVLWSGDGGVTWSYTCAPDGGAYGLDCTGAPLSGLGTFGSDPALAWGENGDVFLNYMLLCAVTTSDIRFALVVARSTDGGATWSARGVIKDSWTSGQVEDKNFYAIDGHPSSAFSGRHYACWDRDNDQKVAYSINDGLSWTEVDLPTPDSGEFDIGCDLTVTDSGVVHVVWNRLTCAASCTDALMYHSRSNNGGVSWSTPVQVHDYRLVDFSSPPNDNCASAQEERCLNTFGSLAVDDSGGPCRGCLYVAYTDVPAGTGFDPDKSNVYVRTSADAGATWSAAVKANSDGVFSLNAQFHPWLELDRGNRHPVVGWHDTRNDTAHRRVDYFVARSSDCGATWTEQQISAPSDEFNNAGISYTIENSSQNSNANPNQFGEYLGLDVHGGRAFMAWTDSRHFEPSFVSEPQKENVGFVEVRFPEIFLDGFETGDGRVWSSATP
jgi:hypothetical protein